MRIDITAAGPAASAADSPNAGASIPACRLTNASNSSCTISCGTSIADTLPIVLAASLIVGVRIDLMDLFNTASVPSATIFLPASDIIALPPSFTGATNRFFKTFLPIAKPRVIGVVTASIPPWINPIFLATLLALSSGTPCLIASSYAS